MIATESPVPIYIAVIFHPKSPQSSTIATSFTIGDEIRKEKVTPRGTPPSTNPIKRGTAEHEQKGVTTPSKAASMFPINSFLWESIPLVLSGGKKLRMNEMAKMMTARRINIFAVS